MGDWNIRNSYINIILNIFPYKRLQDRISSYQGWAHPVIKRHLDGSPKPRAAPGSTSSVKVKHNMPNQLVLKFENYNKNLFRVINKLILAVLFVSYIHLPITVCLVGPVNIHDDFSFRI